MRRKILGIALGIILVLSVLFTCLVACGDNEDDNKGGNPFGPSDGIELPPVEWEPDEEF